MTARDRTVLAIGLGIGAWIVPAGGLLAARLANRHYLDTKE